MCLNYCLELEVFNTILCFKQVSFVIYVYVAYRYGNESLEFMNFSFTNSIQTAIVSSSWGKMPRNSAWDMRHWNTGSITRRICSYPISLEYPLYFCGKQSNNFNLPSHNKALTSYTALLRSFNKYKMLGCGGKLLRFLNFALDEGEWPGFTLRPLYFRVGWVDVSRRFRGPPPPPSP